MDESNVLALSQMKHMLPLNNIFPPTYLIFSMVVWRHNLPCTTMGSCEDSKLLQELLSSMAKAIKQEPIRDVCLQETHALYCHLACETSVYVFATRVEMQGFDMHYNLKAFVSLPR